MNSTGGNITGTITDIQRFSVHDGPGIRTVVFLKGCPLGCLWCHNPETRSVEPQLMYNPDACISCGLCLAACQNHAVYEENSRFLTFRSECKMCGTCCEACFTKARQISGRRVRASEIMKEIESDSVFYKTSGGGVTLSGGEPTCQPAFASEVLRQSKQRGFHTAVETCGYCSWDVLEKFAENTDLFLFDVKHTDDKKHRRYTGVSNQPIQKNLERLAECGAGIVIRIPLITGINDDEENIRRTADIAKKCNAIELHILPFHQIGASKYYSLDMPYELEKLEPPEEETIKRAADILHQAGLIVSVGGGGEYRV